VSCGFHLILVGDVIQSAGTRSYIRELIHHLRQADINLQVHIFQFRLDVLSFSGLGRIPDFDQPVYIAPGASVFRWLPRVLYRLFERMVLLVFLGKALKTIAGGDGLIGSGCLGGIHLFGSRIVARGWWLKLGLIEEEGAGTLRYRLRKQIEAMHARRFPNRIVVSKPMGEFVAAEYGTARGEELILPCLVDMERFPEPVSRQALRVQLGIAERFVVTYVGNAASWQCAAETVRLFELIRERLPNALFWVFTPDRQRFNLLLKHLPAECWKIEFRPHQELSSLLPAADVACLLRKRELVNRVASPLKFPEYMACGLPVLIGPEVGQYSALVSSRRLGAIIDPEAPEEWEQALVQVLACLEDKDIRLRCRKTAIDLSWLPYQPKLAEVFRSQYQ
jgi:glycosyltransferase involved in cell wall biosynthesis